MTIEIDLNRVLVPASEKPLLISDLNLCLKRRITGLVREGYEPQFVLAEIAKGNLINASESQLIRWAAIWLDAIQQGRISWDEFISRFVGPVKPDLD